MSLAGLAGEAPILGRVDELFNAVSPKVPITAGSLAPRWPATDSTPVKLRLEIVHRGLRGESTDPPWSGIVMRTRLDPADWQGQLWRLIAVGVAQDDLQRIAARYHPRTHEEQRDIHADLTEGFLSFLARVDLDQPHIARRLAYAAGRELRRGRKARFGEIPTDPGWLAQTNAELLGLAPLPDSGAHDWSGALDEIAEEVAAAGYRLDPIGLELIARTIIEGQSLVEAAALVGLSVDAAYKRRSRTEDRIAAVYGISSRRRAPGRIKPPDHASGAMEAVA
ncbi:hypothetical protein AB0H43_12485 [Hamadaea sp. NPDC050747]|uniref:hypothetical protein n=1 Tax=Hamadaea sp. NPDC050747 TaxID=3155789 RepID=UPI0033F1BEC2